MTVGTYLVQLTATATVQLNKASFIRDTDNSNALFAVFGLADTSVRSPGVLFIFII